MKYSTLPVNRLQSWACLNDVTFHGTEVQAYVVGANGISKGGGLVATRDHALGDTLLIVPRELILNRASIEDAARNDKHLRQLLDAVGAPFLQSPRILMMVFMLLQLTHRSPDLGDKKIGISAPLTDYVNFLPKDVFLPTMYSTGDQDLLQGTSLESALKQKLRRLDAEFEHFKSSTQSVDWCQQLWWEGDEPVLTLRDWKVVDTIYRSRALELPDNIGDSMVPVLDMANHASDDRYNARFQPDESGNVKLVVRDEARIANGEEITIMYGCGGACEMIFSYGFLDEGAQSAREVFLDLEIPEDDPLKRAKIEFAKEAPGVRIYTDGQAQIKWESSFVWWACVNEEDGLEFRILQRVDGSTELEARWKQARLIADDFRNVLAADALWDIFQLRAVTLVQNRIETQGIDLSNAQDTFENARHKDHGLVLDLIGRLRDLELGILAAAFQTLDAQKVKLLGSDTVRAYLQEPDIGRFDGPDEDFS